MLHFISDLLGLVSLLIIADAILSWVMPSPDRFPRSLTSRLTAPLYAPIHAIVDPRKTGGLDFAPVVVLVAIHFIRRALGG
ncbi:MAG: YggT family protein [Myxococcales bacterium]|nr:YggT family protein [Myxococcales bacterium]